MRFRRVTAHAFGMLRDEELSPDPGMTVVYGPNEAGKSTWHAALTWGLCGRPLPRGRKKAADSGERYRPWAGDAWAVSVELELAGGRRVQLRQDFADPKRSAAHDLSAGGRDVSSEIIGKGDRVPDGSRWLGLDRASFRAVASVEQAQMLAVRENAKRLESALQQAAGSLGGDVAAAEAIERLRRFLSDEVGREARNVTRPLQRAKEAAEEARRKLQEARRRYEDFGRLAEELEQARRRGEEARSRCDVLEAAAALAALRGAEETLRRARELAEQTPEGEPPDPEPDERRLRQAEQTLRRWRDRPERIHLGERSSEQIRAEIAALPDVPDGDREPHPEAQAAWEEYRQAQAALALLGEAPQVPPRPVDTTVRPEELERLAETLGEPVPAIDPDLDTRLSRARQQLESMPMPWSRAAVGALLAAGLAAAAGFWAADLRAAAAVTAAVTAGVVLWALRRGDAAARLALLEEVRALEQKAGEADARRRLVEERRVAATERVRELRLAPDASLLRARAGALRSWERKNEERAEWERRRGQAEERKKRTASHLIGVLRARGEEVPAESSADSAWAAYVEACRRRAEAAVRAGRRADLERELATREELERRARDVERARREAAEALRQAAVEAGLPGGAAEEETAQALEAWLDRERQRLSALGQSRLAWQKLQGLLAGRSMADLEAAVTQARQRWEEWKPKVDVAQAEAAAARPDVAAALEAARKARDTAERDVAERAGRVREAESRLPDVAALEEDLQAAQEEEARVRALKEVLETTIEILESAEEQVHRDIAPRIAEDVSRHLPRVTGGRYRKALVDPETLAVRVACGNGVLRDAEQLSHGTSEQVYLLLRVALARLLCKGEERCPLLLDDPTVQSDAGRTKAILELLREVSREHQVIVFSQEDEVLAWAEERRKDGVHLVRLRPPAAGEAFEAPAAA